MNLRLPTVPLLAAVAWLVPALCGAEEARAPAGAPAPAPAPLPAEAGERLDQNDPNPCRDRTTIRFRLEERTDILLTVLDLASRRVRTLWEGTLGPGTWMAEWDGRDADGVPVDAGIYFYRLQGPDIDETRKLVLLR